MKAETNFIIGLHGLIVGEVCDGRGLFLEAEFEKACKG